MLLMSCFSLLRWYFGFDIELLDIEAIRKTTPSFAAFAIGTFVFGWRGPSSPSRKNL